MNFDTLLNSAGEIAVSMGADFTGKVDISDVSVEEWLAEKCVQPKCENYGLSASCPPYVKGPDEFRSFLEDAKAGIVIIYNVPGDFAFNQDMIDIMRLLHETSSAIEHLAIDSGYDKSIAFTGGSCKNIFCSEHEDCKVIEGSGECRYLATARRSMSGYGVNVKKLVEASGFFHNKESSVKGVQITGLVLVK